MNRNNEKLFFIVDDSHPSEAWVEASEKINLMFFPGGN